MKKRTISALIGFGLFLLYGLFYLIFPAFITRVHLHFGLGDKGLFVLGIGFIVFGIIWGLLTLYSKTYRRLAKRFKKRRTLFFLVVGGWYFLEISGILILIFVPVATGLRVAQSMGMF